MIILTTTSKILPTLAFRLLILLSLFFAFSSANAHAPNENYVWLNAESDHLLGRFELKQTDLKKYLNIDTDQLDPTNEESLETTAETVIAYFEDNFKLTSDDGELVLTWQTPTFFEENPEYVQYWFRVDDFPTNNRLSIQNRLFLSPDHPAYNRLHRSVIVVEYNKRVDKEFGAENSVLVFSSKKSEAELDLANPTTILNWKDFLWQGVLHILIGLDHIIFLIVLLLTVVLQVRNKKWESVPGFKQAFFNTLKLVTLFTIAHSITLSLAALQLVDINISFVESVIAFSIIAICINNIFPRYNAHAWLMVFVFGLFHGLGFASVMGDLQFRTVLIERILILFNVGVELGQLAILVVVFPLIYYFRDKRFYYPVVVVPLSLIAMGIASIWVLERSGVVT